MSTGSAIRKLLVRLAIIVVTTCSFRTRVTSQIICDQVSYPIGDFRIRCMEDFLGRLAVDYGLPASCVGAQTYDCEGRATLYGYRWAASCTDWFDPVSCLRTAAAMVWNGCPNSVGGRAWARNGGECLVRVESYSFQANESGSSAMNAMGNLLN